MVLSGCTAALRDSKKESFCFKIIHPSKKAHRSGRLNYDSLILAADSDALQHLWIAAIETAISASTDLKSDAAAG